jgi:ADP-heptose:LPS heptosyltransferase
MRALAQASAEAIVTDLAPLLGDFADTAAAIEGLDLVIMTDTAVAHLAGCLGKPIWNLLPKSGYWPYPPR